MSAPFLTSCGQWLERFKFHIVIRPDANASGRIFVLQKSRDILEVPALLWFHDHSTTSNAFSFLFSAFRVASDAPRIPIMVSTSKF